MRKLFEFPDPVNEVSARLVAGFVVLLGVLTIALDVPWLLLVIAYGFVARVLTGPTLSPLGKFVTRVLTPRLHVAPKYVPGPPKRFAQGIGAVLLERSAYDQDGNCQSATLMDYLVPTACDIPRIEIAHLQTVPLDTDVNFPFMRSREFLGLHFNLQNDLHYSLHNHAGSVSKNQYNLVHVPEALYEFSIATGGGVGLLRSAFGSTMATPPMVGNHSFPSLALIAAGSLPPLHSALSIPSFSS